MYAAIYRIPGNDERFLYVGLEKFELTKQTKKDFAVFNLLHLMELGESDLEQISLLIVSSDSSGAYQQALQLRRQFSFHNPGRLLFVLLMPARDAMAVRDKGYVHKESLEKPKLQIRIYQGAKERLFQLIQEEHGEDVSDTEENA